MSADDGRPPIRSLVVGLALLFVPALIILTTLEFLILSGDLVLRDISLLVIVELYLIELVVFGGSAYVLYRLLYRTVPLPEEDTTEAPGDDDSGRE